MSGEVMVAPPFTPFPSIARLSRDMIVTEKLDGTNAQIYITDDGIVHAGSRNRWITPEADNFGFARWVQERADSLRAILGPGQHFGEWWGSGIQRGYGLPKGEKRFSLFNTSRWAEYFGETTDLQGLGVYVVPVLAQHTFDTGKVDEVLVDLMRNGSRAAPGFMQPEGVVVFHAKSGQLFKKTLDKNDGHKGAK